jgi:hypothetical protein
MRREAPAQGIPEPTTTWRRRVVASAAASLLGAVVAVTVAGPAWATSGYTYWGPTASYGFYDYDGAASPDWLHLIASPTTLASGKCYDEILDWNPEDSSHYDARLARSCKSSTERNTQVSHEAYDVASVPNKLGTCYGPNQATNVPVSNCKNVIGNVGTVVTNVGATQYCVRAWSMTPSGTLQYFSGGDPTDCYS